jgi:hypothetical protein
VPARGISGRVLHSERERRPSQVSFQTTACSRATFRLIGFTTAAQSLVLQIRSRPDWINSSKFVLVTVTTQVWPEPLISDSEKMFGCFGLSRCFPVNVGRRDDGAHADVPGSAVLVGEGLGLPVALDDTVDDWVADPDDVADEVAVGSADADSLVSVLGVRIVLAIGLGEGVSATAVGAGRDGFGWTAEPRLVPLTIRAITMARIRTAAPTTSARRTQ